MALPLVAPFRAERFADLSGLSRRIAPPYDVIGPAQRETLAGRDPHNIVHLILPEAPEGGDRYVHAASVLTDWRRAGVLVPDGDPAVYVVRQSFVAPGGEQKSRTGVIAAVVAEPYQEGRVKPHELTHKSPKEDRLALTRATGAMFESLFMFTRDEGGQLADRLSSATRTPAIVTAVLDGVEIDMWRVTGADAATIAQLAGAAPLYIADGHHRYETAVAYRSEFPDATRVPALIVSKDDPGLVVLPTHRLISGAPLEPKRVIDRLRERFQIRELDPTSNYVEELASIRSRGSAAVVIMGQGRAILALLKSGASLGELPFANEPAVASLDVARIDALVVEKLREMAGEKASVSYSSDPSQVIDSIRDGDANVGILVNSTAVDQVLRVADARAVMPPKSTYFMPKVPSGLLVVPLGGGQ